jgi:hypothetical protein
VRADSRAPRGSLYAALSRSDPARCARDPTCHPEPNEPDRVPRLAIGRTPISPANSPPESDHVDRAGVLKSFGRRLVPLISLFPRLRPSPRASFARHSPLPPPPSTSPFRLGFRSPIVYRSIACVWGVGCGAQFGESFAAPTPIPRRKHFSAAGPHRVVAWCLCFAAAGKNSPYRIAHAPTSCSTILIWESCAGAPRRQWRRRASVGRRRVDAGVRKGVGENRGCRPILIGRPGLEIGVPLRQILRGRRSVILRL